MANECRYVRGHASPVPVPRPDGTAVPINSAVAIVGGNAVAAANFTWTTDLATTQANFHAAFAGVAAQDYDPTLPVPYGTTNGRILVAPGPDMVWRFDCATASFNVGDRVGMAKAAGNALENRKVVAVGSDGLAIGTVEEAGTNVTSVLVRISSPKIQLMS